jgi:acetylornithine/succinyldiaminopimelate/putrescine aminotransferase
MRASKPSARTFIALERGFHGKTLGALQLTANPAYREPFTLAGVPVVRVPANDLACLEAAFAQTSDLAGFIFEPVLGEGGVFPLTAAFVRRAAELCAQRDVPLIADECQTGLGRTGTFLACAALGVQPDYVILSKALGGGPDQDLRAARATGALRRPLRSAAHEHLRRG